MYDLLKVTRPLGVHVLALCPANSNKSVAKPRQWCMGLYMYMPVCTLLCTCTSRLQAACHTCTLYVACNLLSDVLFVYMYRLPGCWRPTPVTAGCLALIYREVPVYYISSVRSRSEPHLLQGELHMYSLHCI